jgi:hypothetical protein
MYSSPERIPNMKPLYYPFLVLILLFALLTQCNVPSDPSDPTSGNSLCSELAGSRYNPVTLGELLCVARDSTGVFYIIDSVGSTLRCFISRNDSLLRKTVLGSGIISQEYYFISIQDDAQLIFRNANNSWSDAYIWMHGKCTKCDSLLSSHMDSRSLDSLAEGWKDVCEYLKNESANCHSLAIAAADDIQNYHCINFPPATRIEYLALQQQRYYLLVTRDEYDWTGDVVVHYGIADQMQKRDVVSFSRARDGGSTWIKFMVGLQQYEAFFGVQWDSTGIHPGNSYIKIDTDTIAVERISWNREILTELGFDCEHEIR